MKTLYDLLGALPHDDAEGLRAAFRRAVKGTHPDLRPDDPEAALKFREIVRANEILFDSEQREAYDHLLELAQLEQDQASRNAVAAKIHKLASGMIAIAGAAVVTAGGYLLFIHMSAASIAPANNADDVVRAPVQVAFVTPARARDSLLGSASPAKDGRAGNPAAASGAHANVPRTNAADGAAAEPVAAVSPQPRGPSADRFADATGLIARLGHASPFDPQLLPTYADRGVIFYRARKFHGFPDIARAKPAEKPHHPKSQPVMARKPHVDQVAAASPAMWFFQRRAAAQDFSRDENMAASAKLR